jgi:hypothetical protein
MAIFSVESKLENRREVTRGCKKKLNSYYRKQDQNKYGTVRGSQAVLRPRFAIDGQECVATTTLALF